MIVKNGYCAGLEFNLEGTMEEVMGKDQLSEFVGFPVIVTAEHLGMYTQDDAPFYYGKINKLAYLVSHGDLYDD